MWWAFVEDSPCIATMKLAKKTGLRVPRGYSMHACPRAYVQDCVCVCLDVAGFSTSGNYLEIFSGLAEGKSTRLKWPRVENPPVLNDRR